MNERHGRPWPSYLLGLAAIGAIVAAYLVVGPPSETTASETRIVTAQRGVVQSTVSGSGNVEAAKQLDLGFKTSGVVHRIYVAQGQHVVEGQLLAELDPGSAEVTLEQARATLKTAEATLAKEEETDGEGSSSTGSGTAGRTGATAASVENATLAYQPGDGTAANGTPANGQEPSTQEQTKTETSATEAPSSTNGAPSSNKGTSAPSTSSNNTSGGGSSSSTTNPSSNSKNPSRGGTNEKSVSTTPSTSTTSSSDTKLSSAAKAANIASASAAVKSDKLAVQSDEQALANTKLYAPETGTLVSLSGEVGETVSATGTTKASSSSGSEGAGSSSSSSAAAALGGGGTGSSGNSGSGSSDSSSSSFAVLSDLSSMQLVVSIGESEIDEIKEGQPATVTIEALEGRKLAAEVSAISTLPTSTSGVVSYDVTFALSQLTEGLKPGMSATAEVVVKQAEGVNLPTSAVTGGTVTVLQSGKQVRRSVVTGLAGNSSTIVISGLKAGEQVLLPAARSSNSSSSLLSRLGSRLGGGGLGGGGLGGGGALRRAGGFAAGPLGG